MATQSYAYNQDLNDYYLFDLPNDNIFIYSWAGSETGFAADFYYGGEYTIEQYGPASFILIDIILEQDLEPGILPPIPTLTLDEDGNLTYDLSQHEFAPGYDPDQMFWQFDGSFDTELFNTIQIQAPSELYIEPNPNANGSGTINLELHYATPDFLGGQEVSVQVISVNDPPQITNLPVEGQEASVGMLYQFTVEAEDIDHLSSELTFSLVPGQFPEGMEIDPGNGAISWIPTQEQASDQTALVR
ncbi:MAG: hypothetical protein GY869_07295, partial [Planctomycetes bacterium]|nr:hypothetical protein [Planctomycetota bacterium]